MDWIIAALASDADLDEILAIEAQSFTNPWTREMYLAELEHPGVAFFFLARTPTGQAAGFCAFWRVLDELHINNLAVLEGFRRRGLGSLLLSRVIEEGVRLGARSAMLEVRESNQAARRLYERFGFVVAGVRPDYYTKPVENALVLRLAPLATS
jgi:ribosomal-protein-alanine N-acetyltransferase